jgi:hypothetical protein
LEVRIVEIISQRLVIEVFAASKHQRTMMTFPMVMTEVTAMCAIEMIMTATAMCRMEMMRRLPTMLLLVVTSRVLSKEKTTTSSESPRRCVYNTGRKSIFHKI